MGKEKEIVRNCDESVSLLVLVESRGCEEEEEADWNWVVSNTLSTAVYSTYSSMRKAGPTRMVLK